MKCVLLMIDFSSNKRHCVRKIGPSYLDIITPFIDELIQSNVVNKAEIAFGFLVNQCVIRLVALYHHFN